MLSIATDREKTKTAYSMDLIIALNITKKRGVFGRGYASSGLLLQVLPAVT